MRNHLIFFLLFIGNYLFCQSYAEKIINTTNSDQTFGAIELNNDIYFSLTSTDLFFGTTQRNVIYHSDANLKLIDSLDLTFYKASDNFDINNIIPASDSTFWVLGNAHFNQTGTTTVYAILIDEDLNILKEFEKASPLGKQLYGLNLTSLDTLLIACGYEGPISHPNYWVWDNSGNVIKSIALDTLGGGMTAISNHNGRLLFGLTFTSFYSHGEINSNDFTVKEIMKDDLVRIPIGFLYVSDFLDIPGIVSDSILAYGSAAYKMALMKMDSSLVVYSVDTFSTKAGNPTAVDRGLMGASADNKIYFATGENPKFTSSDLKPGLTNSMRLWRIKTNGDEVWSYIISDSSYYFPTKTVATSDGGAVFFSMKYDWRIDSLPKTSLSIIKLDSTGNFVALSEMEIPYTERLGVDIFPNPCRDHITLEGIEARDVRRVLIYNIKGEVVAQYQNLENLKIETSMLENGSYLLQIVMKNGQIGVYKLMKK